MSFFNEYPYRNITDLNLDWLIKAINTLKHEVNDFVTMNAIKYANPIDWSITRQYEKNTVVMDASTGIAYLSVAAVPSGMDISRTDYWTVIFDLSRFLEAGVANLAVSYERSITYTATVDTNEGAWVVWNGTLFEALNDIHVGDRYVIDGNIKKTTVEEFYNRLASIVNTEIENRINADSLLQHNIDAEATARTNADNQLQQAINDEITARQTAVSDEATARENADNQLHNEISTESTARENADAELQRAIDTETSSREVADTTLRNYIDGAIASLNTFHNGIIFGNSYASGTGSPDHYGIYHYLAPLFDNAYLFSGSGTSFIDYDGQHQNDTFLTLLNQAINSSEFENDSIDTIFIIGAYGESRAFIQNGRDVVSTRNALRSPINSFKSIASSNFSNLKRIYYVNAESRLTNKIESGGYISFISDSYQVDNVLTPLLLDNQIVSLGWCGIDAIYQSTCFSNDGYHPNTAGYRAISTSIINRLNGGVSTRYYEMTQNLDISRFVGVAGTELRVNFTLTPTQSNWSAEFARIASAATVTLSTDLVAINLDNVVIPPPRNTLAKAYVRSGVVEDKAFNVLSEIYIADGSMWLGLKANRTISAAVQAGALMSFELGDF